MISEILRRAGQLGLEELKKNFFLVVLPVVTLGSLNDNNTNCHLLCIYFIPNAMLGHLCTFLLNPYEVVGFTDEAIYEA